MSDTADPRTNPSDNAWENYCCFGPRIVDVHGNPVSGRARAPKWVVLKSPEQPLRSQDHHNASIEGVPSRDLTTTRTLSSNPMGNTHVEAAHAIVAMPGAANPKSESTTVKKMRAKCAVAGKKGSKPGC